MTVTEIIYAIQKGGVDAERAWMYMYKNWSGAWRSEIIKLGGTADDADDALASVYKDISRTISAPDFELKTAGLLTYMVTCVRNAWFKQLRGRNKIVALDERPMGHSDDDAESGLELSERNTLLDQVLSQIGQRCQTILTLWAERFSGDEIAVMLGFAGGSDTVKKEKYKCWQKLMDFLRTNAHISNQLKDFLS